MANFKKFRLKRILVNSLPAFLVAGLVLSANLYFDLDLGRVVMNEITRITQNLEVLTGQIIGANNEQLLLGTTNDLVEVVRGGQTYLVCDASGNCAGSFGYAFASGTTNYLAKFTSASSLGNSIVLDNGNLVSILGQLSSQGTTTLATSSGNVGIGTTTPLAKLHLINGTFLIDNPLNPIRVGNVDTGYTISLYVSDKYAFVAAGYSNLHIVDISRPSNPTIISTYATSGYGLAVRVSGQYAYLANESGYFQIIDISNPSNPTWVATYNPGHNTRDVYLSGKYAFVLAGAKVFVVDISNPKNPNLVGSYDFVSPVPSDIYVSGKYAFVAQETAGLAILDISDPTNPTHIQTYNTTGTAYGVYVSGRYAYVADGEAGLQIIDISNPANPTWVGNYNTPGSCGKVFVSGKYAFVADGAYGLQIIDVSNPANPTLVGNYNTPGSAYDVYVSGRYAYVADHSSGLQIIDIFGIDTHAANIGNIFSQNLTVSENVDIANNLYVRNGLNVGVGGIYSQGPISILSSTSSNTVSAFDVKNSAGTPLFYVRNDGNIGIGTTIPSSKLTVSGDLFVSSTSTLANVLPLADNLYNLGSPSLRWANIFAVTTTIGNTITIGSNTFEGSATTTLFTTGNSNQLVLGANGNVGIGTTGPLYALHISKGSDYGGIGGVSILAEYGIGFKAAGNYNPGAYIIGRRGSQNSRDLAFVTANDEGGDAERMTIKANTGYVGIGTTNPPTKLSLYGNEFTNILSQDSGYVYTELSQDDWGGSFGLLFNAYKVNPGVNGYLFATGNTKYKYDPGTYSRAAAAIGGYLNDGSGGHIQIYSAPPGNANNDITWIQLADFHRSAIWLSPRGSSSDLYINSSGNVGIGTTNPSHRLSVVGSQTEPTYGSNLIVNGDFSNGSQGWTVGEGWTITDQATHSTGYTQPLSQDISVTNGTTYQIEWTQTGATAGTLTFSIGSVSSRAISYWEPTKTTITASGSGTQTFSITPSSDYNGSIDNITVRAITSYSQPVFSLLNTDQTTGLEIRTGGTGNYNTFVGLGAGSRNTGGIQNVALGFQALYSNTTGHSNTALGFQALYSNTTSYFNTALGYRALYLNTTGNNNVGVGAGALYSNTTGVGNAAIGWYALYLNTTGYQNSALGYRALYSLTTGYENIAIGLEAGRYLSDGSSPNQTSNRSVYLGTNTKASADGVTNEIVIGYNAVGSGSNSATYGNTSITKHIFPAGNLGIGTTTPSSKLTVSGDLFVSSTSTLANVLPLADNLYNLGSPSLRWANIFAVTTTIGNTITIGSNTFEGSATTTLFTTGNSNQLVLGANGNVGIGTTNPISLLELYKENTSSILTITVATSTTYDPYIAFRTGATPETRAVIGIDYSDSNKLKIVPGSDISKSAGITVDASGRVGIGFEPSGAGFPVSPLHVEGDITIAYGTTIAFNAYYDHDDRYLYSDSAFKIWHDTSKDILYFGAAPPGTSGNPITYNTALVIRNNGNVAIGTTTVSTKLAVSGLTSSQPGRYICSDANGNFYYHTTACVSSSFKFKKDIKDLDLGLDALMNLRPVTFKFNESYGGDDQTTHMGFIAEEVEKITPLLVDYTDGQPTGVRYSEMTALLVKSIQEQQKQIEKMQLAIDEEGDLTYGGKKIVSSENQSLFEAIKKLIKQALSEIEKLFVKEINIERAEIEEAEIKKAIVNQICLRGEDGEEICLTKDQLKSLINNSFTSQNNNQVSETDNETNNETVCLPNWQCTDWQPPAEEICANEIFLQERTCTDLNNCATQEGKPIENQQAVGTKDCQNEK